jgi:hypothetical protein
MGWAFSPTNPKMRTQQMCQYGHTRRWSYAPKTSEFILIKVPERLFVYLWVLIIEREQWKTDLA